MAALSRAADQEGIHLWDLEDGEGRSFQEAHDWLLRAVKPARLGRSTARHDKELRQFRRENHQDPFDLLDFGIQLRGALHIAKLRGLEAEEARAALFTLQHEPTTG